MPPVLSGFEDIIRFLADVMEAYTVALFHYHEREDSIQCVEYHSLSKYFKHNISLPLEKSGLLSQVLNFQQHIHCEKIGEKPINLMIPFYTDQEKLIKALCIFPVDGYGLILYVDTKHKWSFSRKETLWIKRAADLILDVARKNEAYQRKKEYAELLRLFYEAELIIDKGEDVQQVRADRVLEILGNFIEAGYGFLAYKNRDNGETYLHSVTPNASFLTRKEKTENSGSLLHYVFSKKDIVFIPSISKHQSSRYVLFPSEPLPKKGSFVGLFESGTKGDWVVGFLSDREIHVSADEVYGIRRVFKHLVRVIEKNTLKKELDQRTYFDQLTGFFNSSAFQLILQKRFQYAVSQNEPLGLILIQWEPYLKLCTLTTPELLRKWTQQIAHNLKSELLPESATAGILSENRIGILIPNISQNDLESMATSIEYFLTGLELGKRLSCLLRFYTGFSVYPYNVTHIPEMWNKAYASLIERITQKNGIHSEDVSVEMAVELVTRRPRTLRA